MPRIFVMRYDEGLLPSDDLTDEKKKEAAEKLEAFLKDNPEVKFNGTFVDEDGMGIDDWEAPEIDAVEEAMKAIDLAYDNIIEVEKVMP